MKQIFRLSVIAAIALTAMATGPAFGQIQNLDRSVEQLAELNRYPPLRSSAFDLTGEVIGRKIVDRKNKVIGSVSDIIIDSNGSIQSYQVKFDRLNMTESVNLNARELKSADFAKRYSIDIEGSELESLFPQLLAGMETASGEAGLYSVNRIRGAEVLSGDGRRLGKVENILFDSGGTRARGLYVDFTVTGISGKSAAVPFRMVKYENQNGKVSVIVGESDTQTLIDFVKAQ